MDPPCPRLSLSLLTASFSDSSGICVSPITWPWPLALGFLWGGFHKGRGSELVGGSIGSIYQALACSGLMKERVPVCGLSQTVRVKYLALNKYLLNEKILSGGMKEVMVKCLARCRLSTWERQSQWFPGVERAGWMDRKQGRGGGREKPGKGRYRNSEEETTAGRRLVSSWGPDTHSVWS